MSTNAKLKVELIDKEIVSNTFAEKSIVTVKMQGIDWSGFGYMKKAVYDTNASNIVDRAEAVADGAYSTSAARVYDTYLKKVNTWSDGLQYSDGVASVDFNATNLKITAEQINTIQDIDVTAIPEFAGLTVINTITEISTDGTLVGDSDSSIVTEKAIKAYVDNAVTEEDFWDRSAGVIYPKTTGDNLSLADQDIINVKDLKLQNDALITNKVNTNIDTGNSTIDSFVESLGDTVTWLYVIKKGHNRRGGLLSACWDATNNVTEYNEVSTLDIGDTSDVSLSVDIESDTVRLRANSISDGWECRVVRILV